MSQVCGKCGGEISLAENRVIHTADCPWNPDKVRDQAPEAAEPQRAVASLGAARFNRTDAPDKLNPRTALEAALEWLDEEVAAGRTIAHIIVLTGRDAPDHPAASGTRFFQAGTYRHHSQMGLCSEGKDMIRESGQ